MRDFHITSQTLGILSGIYFYSYAAMQMPAGVLMDTFGPRRVLTLATAICAVSTLAFALTESFFMACMARLMIGFGSAFAAIGAMKLAAVWFKPERFAFLVGLMVTIGMLGAIGGEAPLALMIDVLSWRDSMLIMGIVGLGVALLIYLIVRDAPQTSNPKQSKIKTEELPLSQSLRPLFKNKKLWVVATYSGLMFMSTPVFCGLWGVPFLMLKLHLSKTVAANYVSLVFVGWIIAGPLWGIYSNRIGLRKPSLYIASVGALMCSLIFIYAPITTPWLMQLSLLAFGIFSAGFLPGFAIAKELCDTRYTATGVSIMNMMNTVGIALAQPAIGYILDLLWKGEMAADHVRVYSLSSFHIALSLLPIGIFIALILLPRVPETFCKHVHDDALEST
jgi:MFS family permease